jgi:hypothetical protein
VGIGTLKDVALGPLEISALESAKSQLMVKLKAPVLTLHPLDGPLSGNGPLGGWLGSVGGRGFGNKPESRVNFKRDIIRSTVPSLGVDDGDVAELGPGVATMP